MKNCKRNCLSIFTLTFDFYFYFHTFWNTFNANIQNMPELIISTKQEIEALLDLRQFEIQQFQIS